MAYRHGVPHTEGLSIAYPGHNMLDKRTERTATDLVSPWFRVEGFTAT